MLDPLSIATGVAIAMLAGFVKGVVGFGLPPLLMAGLAAVLPVETALVCLIMPSLVTNLWQAFRRGGLRNFTALRGYRAFLLAGGVVMLVSAQLYLLVPSKLMLALIAVLMAIFALSQLAKLQLFGRKITMTGARAQLGFGIVAGFMGGVSGIWGPPTVMMLTAQNTAKDEQVRILGLLFLVGTVMLLASHIVSGVVTPARLALSTALVIPAVLGQALGMRVLDRIDQARFRTITLVVLLLSALNLLRRALIG